LLAWCRQRLAAYKAPRRIWILEADSLPQTHNGKLMRSVLRERFAADMKT
jgi:acyl-CoA synthetase (AMP-forming)/AMP-acid ligase II